jgi:hypothetical protein
MKHTGRVDRYTAGRRCPVCGGCSGGTPNCWGYLSDDGRFARCTRGERSGGLELEEKTTSFVHFLGGLCNCGATHDDVVEPDAARRAAPEPDREDAKQTIKAILDGCDRADTTRLSAYLKFRGLSGKVPPYSLLYHPSLPYFDDTRTRLGDFPTMVAQFEGIDGEVVALHRTYLSPEGPGKADVAKAKKMTAVVRPGALRGSAIRLSHINDVGDRLAITEGIETGLAVLQATATPTWATGSASALQHVHIPARVRMVEIWADHDASGTGQKAAGVLAERLVADGRTVYLMLPPTPGEDWLDVLRTGTDLLLKVAKSETQPFVGSASATSERFQLLHVGDLKTRPSPKRLAGRVLHAGEFSLLVSPSGGGKSFLALDLALSIASGQPWLGRPVAKGPVVYILAEGAPGFRKRVIAWERHREVAVDEQPAYFIAEAVNLLHTADVDQLMQVITALPEPPVLVVVDTLARSMAGGEENSAKEVGAVIGAVGRIQQTFGCAVLVVHHTGHGNQDRERGSSALRAAVDTLIVASKTDDEISLRCEKQRNAEPFEDIAVRLEQVDVGGETTCVVVPSDGTARAGARLSANALRALRALANFGQDVGATFVGWRDASGITKSTFLRISTHLKQDEFVIVTGEGRGALYFATVKGREAIEGSTRVHEGSTDPTGPDRTRVHSGPHSFRSGPMDPTVNSNAAHLDPENPDVVDGVPNRGETIH